MSTDKKNDSSISLTIKKHASSIYTSAYTNGGGIESYAKILTLLSLIVVFTTFFVIMKPFLYMSDPTIGTITSIKYLKEPDLDISTAKLAWLISYPSSRDAFIQKIVHDVSHTTMATNDYSHLKPAAANIDHIPYAIRKSYTIPTKYILVETHCRGYQTFDSPYNNAQPLSIDDVFPRNAYDFYMGCATGETATGGRHVLYNPRTVEKVVHLYRDPLSTVVQRFHSISHKARHNGDVRRAFKYWDDEGGFKRWCVDMNREMREGLGLSEALFELVEGLVPCYGMFYQYALWHNNAIDMINRHDLPTHVAHFEDYNLYRDQFIDELFLFLSLPRVGTPPPYVTDDFSHYFSPDESVAISSFFKVICAEEVWMHLKRYLPAPTKDYLLKPLGVHLSPHHHGAWPDNIVWLMGLPHAGGRNVSRLVEVTSGLTTASNYAGRGDGENRPNVEYGAKGPYRSSPLPFPEGDILTTTYCYNATSAERANLTVGFDDFLRDCAMATKYGGGDDGSLLMRYYYDVRVVRKVIHLIRNPFDSIVAQFESETGSSSGPQQQQQQGISYPHDSKGFHSWCDYKNKQFPTEYTDTKLRKLANQVPCHSLLYQYVQWHNNAFVVSTRLGVRSLVLHYEDFEMKKTMDKLMAFLKLEPTTTIVEGSGAGAGDFIDVKFYEHLYYGLFLDKEFAPTAKFIRMVATGETNYAMRRYFDPTSLSR